MLDTFKQLIGNQYEAVFCTMHLCIDRCPDSAWQEPVAKYPFSQVVFHTLFFADYYLEPSEHTIREQKFHQDNQDFFGDYEQLQPREPTSTYEKAPLLTYLDFCRRKAQQVIAAETAEVLEGPTGFARRKTTRAELHVYNIRHIYHHGAQLSLRLRIDNHAEIPWVGSGWRDDV